MSRTEQARPFDPGPWPLVACLALALLAFAPTLWFEFVNWDDNLHVYDNPLVTGSRPYETRDLLLTPALGYPMPVTIVSYRIEHALVGLDPTLYHATNVLLHLGVCWLVYRIARRFGLSAIGAAAATMLVAVHPVVAEPVSWVTGRKDLLAACFGLGSLLLFTRSTSLRRGSTWIASGLFLLAALSKPVALFLPAAIFGWHWAVGRASARRAALASAPAAVLAVPVFLIAYIGQSQNEAVRTVGSLGLLLREAWYAAGYHLARLSMLEPAMARHVPESMPPPLSPLFDLLPLVWLVLAAAVIVLLGEGRRRRAAYGFALAILAYLPSSSLIPLKRYVADVYLYLPLVGLGLVAGLVVGRLEERMAGRQRKLALLSGLALTGALLVTLTAEVSSHWKNGIALWGRDYRLYPDSPETCRNYGNAFYLDGRLEDALALYTRCSRMDPEFFIKSIAITLFHLERYEESRRLFRQIAAREPNDPAVRHYLPLLGKP